MRQAFILALATLAVCAAGVYAADGIAISTHRIGEGDQGAGVGPSMFGDLIRHDIKDNRVVKSSVLYAGKARGAAINQTGDKVAFLKLDGPICVVNMDGTGLKGLKNAKNHNASAMDWPIGDWVYYSEEGETPDGVWNAKSKADTPDKRTIRRINVVTGEDELVGMTPFRIWQMSLTAYARKGSGKFAITKRLLDFSDPARTLNRHAVRCGTAVSPSGRHVSESVHGHCGFRIMNWDFDTEIRDFYINEWNPIDNDGRRYIYRPRWSVNSEKWIILTHGNNFCATSQTNMVLYNWMDGEQIQVTNNSAQGNENDEGEDFWLVGVSNELGIGFTEGEAPYTVELGSGAQGGRWAWDYGDGTKETAPVGRHTYTKAGTYGVTAAQGDRVLRQTIYVRLQRPPQVDCVDVLDDRNLFITFDERIQLKDAKVVLASTGAPVKRFALNTASRALVKSDAANTIGRTLLIELQDALDAEEDALKIEGVFDTAQQPNPLAQKSIPISPPAWPSRRAGLVFLWQTYDKPSFQYDGVGKAFAGAQMSRWKRVRYDRDGAMLLEGGVAHAVDSGKGIVGKCYKTGRFSIEAVVTPANVQQGRAAPPRRMITLSGGGGPGDINFSLDQAGERLVLSLRTGAGKGAKRSVQRVDLCALTDGVRNHVVVSYAPGGLACYLNGKAVLQTDEVKGALAWEATGPESGLSFGGTRGTTGPWLGKLQGVAVYSRAIDAGEAAENFAAYRTIIRSRPAVPKIEVRARLSAKSTTPRPEDIAPYRNALVVYEYNLEKVLSGKYTQKKIRVAHWGLLDGDPTRITRPEVGDRAEFTVEAFADHPDLEAETLWDTLDENYGLRLYVDTNVWPTGPPRIAAITVRPGEVWLPPGHKLEFRAETFDQYGNPIDAPVQWSVVPGGKLYLEVFYWGGIYLDHHKQKGSGSIDGNGLFAGDGKLGVVTVVASGAEDPFVKGAASVAMDNYPSITPCIDEPMTFGPFAGDLDRIRIYDRALTAEQIASHARGQPLAGEGLVGDWTFDELRDGIFPNEAGKGLGGRIVGKVEHVTGGHGGCVRFNGGRVEVAQDERLDFSHACTLEAWVLPKGRPSGKLINKAWSGAIRGFSLLLDGGPRSMGMHGWLVASYNFPAEEWTHLACVYNVNGVRKLYVDGRLLAEMKPRPIVIRE